MNLELKKISIVVPICNEAENISPLYIRLANSLRKDFRGFQYEIIMIDDGSLDNSLAEITKLRAKDKHVKLISFSRNFGHHIAITAGLDHASGDFIVMMDGDLQDKPEEIVNLYKQLKKGYDVVYAERKNKKFGLLKRLSSALFNKAIRFLINENIVINSTIFRIITKQVNESVRLLRERNRYIVGLFGWVGFKHTFCSVEHGRRVGGHTKYNFSKQLELAFSAITAFSDYPLKIASRVGLIMVSISFFLMIYVGIAKIIYKTPILGWTSLFTAIVLIGGVQIMILGVMGEYLGRNYLESKRRPLYIIKKQLF
jgi:glycosyltransferase involved in cell wall biosynthesis